MLFVSTCRWKQTCEILIHHHEATTLWKECSAVWYKNLWTQSFCSDKKNKQLLLAESSSTAQRFLWLQDFCQRYHQVSLFLQCDVFLTVNSNFPYSDVDIFTSCTVVYYCWHTFMSESDTPFSAIKKSLSAIYIKSWRLNICQVNGM